MITQILQTSNIPVNSTETATLPPIHHFEPDQWEVRTLLMAQGLITRIVWFCRTSCSDTISLCKSNVMSYLAQYAPGAAKSITTLNKLIRTFVEMGVIEQEERFEQWKDPKQRTRRPVWVKVDYEKLLLLGEWIEDILVKKHGADFVSAYYVPEVDEVVPPTKNPSTVEPSTENTSTVKPPLLLPKHCNFLLVAAFNEYFGGDRVWRRDISQHNERGIVSAYWLLKKSRAYLDKMLPIWQRKYGQVLRRNVARATAVRECRMVQLAIV